MANITLDFLHNYHTGERRESDPAYAYQYDEGHVLEAVLPSVVTTVELHYWIRGMEEAEAYTPTSITPNDDNSCTILGNIPNKYFETNGELRIYIVVNDASASITTYEGKLNICQRSKPDDYVDDDPENEATRVLTEARAAAETAAAAAETAQDVADSIPADYSQMSEDVSQLKEDNKNISAVVGKASVSYIGTGSNHSSASDVASIHIRTGEKFDVIVRNSANTQASTQLWAYYLDGTRENIGSITTYNLPKTFTASKDIVGVGLFHATVSGVTYYLDVEAIDWVAKDVDRKVSILSETAGYRNGSGGNTGNANAVTSWEIPLIDGTAKVVVKNLRPVRANGNYFKYDLCACKGSTWYANRKTGLIADNNGEISFTNSEIIHGTSGVTHFALTIWEYDSNDALVPLRYGDFDDFPLVVRYVYDDKVTTLRDIDNQESNHLILNARHATNPLTILHFSDLHADTKALKRILDDASYYYGARIDEKICTGDIVSNTYAEIESWWNSSVLTCIGNHDSASYSDGTYNWTALSMANRDAYYIAPFESNWGITHTSGTSYYYKDYTSAKVRMIVMDAMLYTDNGAEATAQTEWLTTLLASAVENNLHVLIAIHAPHGGASAMECSFSKYGQGNMPTQTDCNTPQSVVDAVAEAISNGLHFIGYLVGHTHQDNIWDCEGDGTQLMYCVTCAAQATQAQWNNSDQDRSNNVDAYNVVTIDTTKTLVKVIRGGGADIDDHMRTRKAICFNYSTGEKVGEVL